MPTTIRDVEDDYRKLKLDGNSRRHPDSVFLCGPLGFCMEFDRHSFLAAIAEEFGLVSRPLVAA